MAHGSDMVGKPGSREYAAKELGLIDVEALDEWSRLKSTKAMSGQEAVVDQLMVKVCNLKSIVRTLQEKINELDSRTYGDVLLD